MYIHHYLKEIMGVGPLYRLMYYTCICMSLISTQFVMVWKTNVIVVRKKESVETLLND